jgi:hypothetical protein
MFAAAFTRPCVAEEDEANASPYVVTKKGKYFIKRAPGARDLWDNAASNNIFHVLMLNCRTNFCM